MKKILIAITLFALTISMAVGALASANPAAATVSTVAAEAGSTVTVNVTLSGAPKIKSIAVSGLEYGDGMELISAEWAVDNTVLSNFDEDAERGVAAFKEETDANGTVIMSITFRIKEGVPEGKYPVSLTVQAKSKNGTNFDIVTKTGYVNVLPNVTTGDVNGDRDINMKDVLMLRKIIAGVDIAGDATAARSEDRKSVV